MGNIYINKQTGDKVKILKEDDGFFTLDDGVRVKKKHSLKNLNKVMK